MLLPPQVVSGAFQFPLGCGQRRVHLRNRRGRPEEGVGESSGLFLVWEGGTPAGFLQLTEGC